MYDSHVKGNQMTLSLTSNAIGSTDSHMSTFAQSITRLLTKRSETLVIPRAGHYPALIASNELSRLVMDCSDAIHQLSEEFRFDGIYVFGGAVSKSELGTEVNFLIDMDRDAYIKNKSDISFELSCILNRDVSVSNQADFSNPADYRKWILGLELRKF